MAPSVVTERGEVYGHVARRTRGGRGEALMSRTLVACAATVLVPVAALLTSTTSPAAGAAEGAVELQEGTSTVGPCALTPEGQPVCRAALR